jgi:kynureninase
VRSLQVSGQAFDLGRIAAAARAHGIVVGYDLAHAAGNLSLSLHDWGVDFAVWCSYKYLNAGPGGVGGCFVHERHADLPELPRLAGWWGNDPQRRFRMHNERTFIPAVGADGWQLSNPPILAMAPLRASLALFDEATMPQLRSKSVQLTGYLQAWVEHAGDDRVSLLTPREVESRGCQLSLRVSDGAERLFAQLREAGIVVDYRQPDVIRAAPTPLYNSFHDVWLLGRALTRWASSSA